MPSIIADLYDNSKLKENYSDTNKYYMPMHDEIDPALKDKDYCLQITKAAFSTLMRDRTALPGSAYRYMQVLRNYGSGNQDEDYYINLFRRNQPSNTNSTSGAPYDSDGVWTENKSAKRQGLDHLNTQIVSVATNLKNGLRGIFSYDQNCYVNSIDNASIEAEEKKMYGALFDAENADFINMVQQQFGIKLSTNSNFPDDITLEELQTYKDMGGFRSEWAIALEQLISYTLKKSDWDNHIKLKWIDDAFDLNIMAGRCVYDPETCEERMEYVDPENVVAQFSIEQNFDDSDYKGYFTLEKLSRLVQRGFSRKELVQAAKRWESYFGNARGIEWHHVEAGDFFDERLREFQVPVFHFYWVDCDVKRSLKTTNKYRTVINEIDFDAEVKPVSDYRKKQGVEQEEMRTRIRKGRQCSWIVDTELTYDVGLIPNQARKSQKKEPLLPILIWRGVHTNRELIFGSVIESIIPFLDNLQLAWLKYQDALIKANPSGYLINLRLLQNLEIDGRKISPIEAFEMFFKTGRMPYMDTPLGENYKGGSVLPMTKVEGNMGELMSVVSAEIHFNLAMIEKFTGISSTPLGVAPDKNQPVTATQMASSGTNNVLRPFFDGIFGLKERMCDYTARRIQLLIRNNEKSRKSYGFVIGDRKIRMLKDMERLGADYGMYMETRPEQQEVQQLMAAAEEALSPGRDGKIQINLSQYMYIMEQIRSGGNLKKLARDLDFMIRRNEKEQMRIAQANVQEQAARQAQMKQEEAQMDLIKQQGEAKSKMAQDNNQAKNIERQKQIDANNEFKKMLYQARLDLMKNGITAEQQSEQLIQ